MLNKVNDLITKNYIKRLDPEIPDIEKEKISFGMKVMLHEVEKNLIIVIFFIAVGRFIPLVISMITLMGIRVHMGGIHMKKDYQCFIITFMYFTFVIGCAENIHLTTDMVIVVHIITAILVIVNTPIQSRLRNINDHKTRMGLKIKVGVTIAVISMCELIPDYRYSRYIVWSLVFILVEVLIHMIVNIGNLKSKELRKEKV